MAKTLASPEIQTSRTELEFLDAQKRHRAIGNTALTGERLARNNDPLAHVNLLMEGKEIAEVESRIYTEFITDQGERAKKRHFNRAFNYEVAEDDLISDTGMSLRNISAGGLAAAEQDLQDDPRLLYAAARAEIQATHTDKLLDWYRSDNLNSVLISSLCPDEAELPQSIAKLSNFKTERQMASMWLFERTDSGIRMHAFSLDNLDLPGLQKIYDGLGIEKQVSDTTLEQLTQLTSLPITKGANAVEAIRCLHDASLDREKGGEHFFGIDLNEQDGRDSNALVEEKTETYELYKLAVHEVASSLKNGEASDGLGALSAELRRGFPSRQVPPELYLNPGQRLDDNQARDFMEYLRSQAIPEYIYGDRAKHEDYMDSGTYSSASGGSYSGISSAGAYAASNGIKHEGACPSSGGSRSNSTNPAISSNRQMTEVLQVYQSQDKKDWKWQKGYCTNGFDDCGNRNKWVMVGPCSVCEQCQERYDAPAPSVLDVLAQYWKEVTQKDRQRRYRQKIKEQEAQQLSRAEVIA